MEVRKKNKLKKKKLGSREMIVNKLPTQKIKG